MFCVCVAEAYIMENTSVVGQEQTWLEECHGHECSRTKSPSLLLGFNSLKGTLGSIAPKPNHSKLSHYFINNKQHDQNETRLRHPNYVLNLI